MKATCLTICLLALICITGIKAQALTQYLTPHFNAWLKANGYGGYNFERRDIPGGSYGGKVSDDDTIEREPVIFFHGNSDHAIGNLGDEFNGFTDSILYFQSHGYKEREIYITTWGPANKALASQQYHSYEYLSYLRAFTEAVLKYTGAKKVDIIAHSMGVTLARKVIKGGTGVDKGKRYDLGPSLAPNVDTFLGIAGANLGLVACYLAFGLPTCGKETGFYPGSGPGPIALSGFLKDLLDSREKEGDYAFSMLSTADDLIMYEGKVWGKYTSKFPTEDDSKIYTNLGHMALKTQTAAQQLQIITSHRI